MYSIKTLIQTAEYKNKNTLLSLFKPISKLHPTQQHPQYQYYSTTTRLYPHSIISCISFPYTFYSSIKKQQQQQQRYLNSKIIMENKQKVEQPKWNPVPPKTTIPKLVVNNSLTKKKEEFIPIKGKHIGWYCCGPTVYDASHMGHARAYITFDILRRILVDYFGYNVLYVMNITDVDDKIILGARYKYLFDQYVSKTTQKEDAIPVIHEALNEWIQEKIGGKEIFDKAIEGVYPEGKDVKFDLYVKTAMKCTQALALINSIDLTQLFENSKDILCHYLDKRYGESITDPKIFRNHSAYWEKEFFKDIDSLNIQRPDILTRVSEYVPEIVAYVQQIMEKGYAYEVNGSIYFDTETFGQHPHHYYAKLEPWSRGNDSLIDEGEGSLSKGVTGKKNKNDFALWKKGKGGEPQWESPWGNGRPGWHIECSTMASEVLGETMDIHSGGIDLAFPHHDNELAQSEAYYDHNHWVNYFLHAGHLHIEGQKMSKSLKNFVTIQEALKSYTANQIRLMFLLHSWDSVLDYKESTMNEAKTVESTFLNFFINIEALVKEARATTVFTGKHNYGSEEKKLISELLTTQSLFHSALSDNFNTPGAMTHLLDLISKTNIYITSITRDKTRQCNSEVLYKISTWISSMMDMFGIIGLSSSSVSSSVSGSTSKKNDADIADTYLRTMSKFRDSVRQLAKFAMTSSSSSSIVTSSSSDAITSTLTSNSNSIPTTVKPMDYGKQLLDLCDQLRDIDLADLGVLLDDREDGKALIKVIGKESIDKLRLEKQQALEIAELRRQEVIQAQLAKEAAKLEKSKMNPRDMFKSKEFLKLYSQWDDNGIPTHDIEGNVLPKSKLKKLTKEYETQKKLYEKYVQSLESKK